MKETLEEAAENNSKKGKSIDGIGGRYLGFVDGAKWQAAKSYSEEEVLELLEDFEKERSTKVIFAKQWFNKFKK